MSDSGETQVVDATNEGAGANDRPVEAFVFKDVFKAQATKDAFAEFLSKEIKDTLADVDRAAHMTKVRKWRRQREARPATETRDVPFKNSANVSPPLTLVRGNTIYAKMLANYSTKRPFWSGDADNSDFAEHARVMSKLLNFYSKSKFHVNLPKVNRAVFYDLVFEGTKFLRIGWDMQRFKTGGGDGDEGSRYKRNSPAVWPIRMEDFVTRTYWSDVQDMPWCGARVQMSWRDLKDAEAQGRFVDVDSVLPQVKSTFSDGEAEDLKRRGIEPVLNVDVDAAKFYDLFECYCLWDVDGDGLLEDVHCVIEPETRTIVRATLNETGWRLFARLPYLDVPGQLYAIGVGHLLELLQDEDDTYRNMRIDAVRLAMLPQYKTKRGAGVRVGEQAEPFKMWHVDSMDDIAMMPVADVSQTTLPGEQLVNRDADLASGANEAMGGFADSTLKSGGGAEAQQVLMEQGFSVLNAYLEGVDENYAEIGRMLLLVMHQNASLLDLSCLDPEEQALAREVFSMPIEELPGRFRFNIETTDLARNEKSQRENYLAFSAMYSSFVQEIAQFKMALMQAQQAGDTFLAELMTKSIIGKTRIMEKMIEFLRIGDPRKFLPDTASLEVGIEQGSFEGGAAPGAPGAPGGPVAGAAGPGPGFAGPVAGGAPGLEAALGGAGPGAGAPGLVGLGGSF